MNIDPIAAHGGIVGANGSIGRACAMICSEKLSQMTLFGSPQHPTSSRLRMNSLAKDIFGYARERMKRGSLQGMSLWLDRVVRKLELQDLAQGSEYSALILGAEDLSLELIGEICAYLDIECPLQTSIDLAQDLPACELIIATSNNPDYLIFPEHLRRGAVVCDVARPADVAPEVCEKRDDVLILEGGLVQYPDNICFGPNLGYREGVNLACLSETVLLALEGDCQDYSIGNVLSLETVQYLRELAQKHGFSLAGLRMGNREISDQEIEQIYRSSRQFKQVENM